MYDTAQSGVTAWTTIVATFQGSRQRPAVFASGVTERGVAMKSIGLCLLSALVSMAAHGGISDALSASVLPMPLTPASPSIATTPPSLDIPAAGTVLDTPAGGSPRNPGSTPMPAPASTDHYGSPAENYSGTVTL